jgi:predicted permease
MRDVALAARALRNHPLLSIAATLTTALGIGAATAMFSVTHAVLLRPLPYQNPDALVLAYSDLRRRADYGMPFSNENFADIRDATRGSFEDFAAVRTARQILSRPDGTPEQIRTAAVTTNFFRLLGARIVLGRDFEDADGQPQANASSATPGAQPTSPLPAMLVLSYEFWQRRYGGDRKIIGRNLLGGAPRGSRIVGVLAPGFELLFRPEDNVEAAPDVWIANRLTYNNANRNTYSLRPIGRLRPGVTLERAQAEVESAAMQIRENFSLYRTAGLYVRLEPMHTALVEQVRPALIALLGAVIFLLLIACANVANLLLVRASAREREWVVLAALGAGRWRIARRMLAEAFLLTIPGTALGVALAWLGIHELRALAPENLPRLDTIRIDPVVLLFSAATGLAAAFLFGLASTWSAVRPDLMSVLRGSSRTTTPGRRVLPNLIVVSQVALCFVLLTGAGLMFRSFLDLLRIDPGFDPHGLLTFHLLGGRGRTVDERSANRRQLAARLRALPGVTSVTAATPFPLTGGFSTIRWGTAEALSDNTKYQAVDWQCVFPGYFETLRTPLLEGRTFTEADNQPGRNVVVIDQFLAAKAFPHQSAVGKRILIRVRTPEPEWVEVIGVVAHQRAAALVEPGREQVYFAESFVPYLPDWHWAIRTLHDPAEYAAAVRAELHRFDPSLLVTEMAPMETLVRRAQAGSRFSLILIIAFAAIAALLVAVGLYGVLSTAVRQRTAEIGVRMALGAPPASIFRLVIGGGLRLSVLGMAAGLVAAHLLTRAMSTLLTGIKPADWLTYTAMAALFTLVALLASWLPARRAAALDPMTALREE